MINFLFPLISLKADDFDVKYALRPTSTFFDIRDRALCGWSFFMEEIL